MGSTENYVYSQKKRGECRCWPIDVIRKHLRLMWSDEQDTLSYQKEMVQDLSFERQERRKEMETEMFLFYNVKWEIKADSNTEYAVWSQSCKTNEPNRYIYIYINRERGTEGGKAKNKGLIVIVWEQWNYRGSFSYFFLAFFKYSLMNILLL